jgi:hypothetical protein
MNENNNNNDYNNNKYDIIDNSLDNLLKRIHNFPNQIRKNELQYLECILEKNSYEFYKIHGENYMSAIESLELEVLKHEHYFWKNCKIIHENNYLYKISKNSHHKIYIANANANDNNNNNNKHKKKYKYILSKLKNIFKFL